MTVADTACDIACDAKAIRDAIASVVDPEIRALTIADLGILRGVTVDDAGRVTVVVTPTYSGCPAMDAIRAQVARAARRAGATEVEVATVLSPAWTSDWISEAGRAKLAAAGIAPPTPRGEGPRLDGTVLLGMPVAPPSAPAARMAAPAVAATVACPRCGCPDTEELSRFGSTACKALWRCRACAEPFDHFKAF